MGEIDHAGWDKVTKHVLGTYVPFRGLPIWALFPRGKCP